MAEHQAYQANHANAADNARLLTNHLRDLLQHRNALSAEATSATGKRKRKENATTTLVSNAWEGVAMQICDGLQALLALAPTLIEPCLPDVIAYLWELNAKGRSPSIVESAMRLSGSVLDTFARLRQLDSILVAFLDAARSATDTVNVISLQGIFPALATVVVQLPALQIPKLWRVLLVALTGDDVSTGDDATLWALSSSFAHFLQHIVVTEPSARVLQALCDETCSALVAPALTTTTSGTGEASGALRGALALFKAVGDVGHKCSVWLPAAGGGDAVVDGAPVLLPFALPATALAAAGCALSLPALHTLATASVGGEGRWGLEMLLLELALQRMARCHAHIDGDILLASTEADGESARIRSELRGLSSFVLRGLDQIRQTDANTTWDGVCELTSEAQYGVASWSVILDHVALIAAYAEEEVLTRLLSVLVQFLSVELPETGGSSSSHSPTLLTIPGVSMALLLQSSFYEIREIRAPFTAAVLSSIAQCIDAVKNTGASRDVLTALTHAVQKGEDATPAAVTASLSTALTAKHSPKHTVSATRDAADVLECCARLLSLLAGTHAEFVAFPQHVGMSLLALEASLAPLLSPVKGDKVVLNALSLELCLSSRRLLGALSQAHPSSMAPVTRFKPVLSWLVRAPTQWRMGGRTNTVTHYTAALLEQVTRVAMGGPGQHAEVPDVVMLELLASVFIDGVDGDHGGGGGGGEFPRYMATAFVTAVCSYLADQDRRMHDTAIKGDKITPIVTPPECLTAITRMEASIATVLTNSKGRGGGEGVTVGAGALTLLGALLTFRYHCAGRYYKRGKRARDGDSINAAVDSPLVPLIGRIMPAIGECLYLDL
jgi:hypothetical protein